MTWLRGGFRASELQVKAAGVASAASSGVWQDEERTKNRSLHNSNFRSWEETEAEEMVKKSQQIGRKRTRGLRQWGPEEARFRGESVGQ